MKNKAYSCIKSLFLLLAAVASLGFSGFSWAEIITLKPPRPVVWKDFLGVNAHLVWFAPPQYREQYTRQFQYLKALGLEWVRVDVHWAQHEYPQGVYHLQDLDRVIADLEANQLKSVVYVVGSASHATLAPPDALYPDQYPPTNPQLFSDFIGMLARRYPSVNAWQVWNEPNLPSYWTPVPDSGGYMDLFRSANDTLRAIDPNKPVVTAGMAYHSELPGGGLMLLELLDLGLLNLQPVVAYQPYNLTPVGNDPVAQDFLSATEYINGFLRGHGAQQIWATEWGWSSYPGPVVEQPIIGENGQADYLLKRLALMSAQDFDRIFLFALSDLDERASPRDQFYGLLDLDGYPRGYAKPAYTALKNFLAATGSRLMPAEPPLVEGLPSSARLYSIAWKRDDGRNVWVYWGDPGYTLTLPNVPYGVGIVYDPIYDSQLAPAGRRGVMGVRVPLDNRVRVMVW